MGDKDTTEEAPERRLTLAPRTFSLMPHSLGEAMELAKLIANSDFAPKDYKNKPGNVVIAIQMGADVGLRPMQALQNIAVINGRPSIWGDAAVALCMPVLERFHETIEGEGDARVATCIVRRKEFPDEVKRTFSVADAKQANLWGKAGPWCTYPNRMLQMRARGFALRDAAADALMGLILAEEAQDYPTPVGVIDITAPEPEAVQKFKGLPEELGERIEKAFELMNLAPGLRLAKLNEYMNAAEGTDEEKAEKLLEWCKNEYANRQGKTRAPKPDGNGKPSAAPVAATTETKSAPHVIDAEVVKATEAPKSDEIFKKPAADVGF